MTALITGGTGFIGRRLVARLERPRVLTRSEASPGARAAAAQASLVTWDGGPLPGRALEGIDTLFHLAGEPVAEGRWGRERKARIRDSRVQGTRALVEAIRRAESRPKVLVSASAVGFYGSRGDEVLDERSAPGRGFLADVCRAWEQEALAAEALGVRVVCVRIGVVLGLEGGALQRMLPVFRLGLGGPLGSGRQWVPWIHVDDLVGLLLHAAARTEVSGPMNCVAPQAVTNAFFTDVLGQVLHRPALIRAPAFALRVVLGEMAEVVLASQRVVPEVAERTGYAFGFPSLAEALTDLLGAPAAERPALAEVRR